MLENSRITQTHQEIAGSARFFRSLLVAATMKRLAEQFAAERSNLEGQWDRGSDISTEDLRIALRRYRSFFGRLLSI